MIQAPASYAIDITGRDVVNGMMLGMLGTIGWMIRAGFNRLVRTIDAYGAELINHGQRIARIEGHVGIDPESVTVPPNARVPGLMSGA